MPDQTMTDERDRRKRVNFLKKAIIALLVIAISVPIILCVVLMYKISKMEDQITELYKVRAEKQTLLVQEINADLPPVLAQPEEEKVPEVSLTAEENDEIRKVYLTFDDGPSGYTDEILDILAEYHVKATFFVLGKEDAHSLAMYKRIVAEGHSLGIHSYSHQYGQIYASKENFAADMLRLQKFLKKNAGVEPYLCRFPGGSSNHVTKVDMQELIGWVSEQNMIYYDWNISSGDASGARLSVDTIVRNCTQNIENYNRSVILMHDSTEKVTTVEALPLIIEKIQDMEDTEILPITKETVPVQHIKSNI